MLHDILLTISKHFLDQVEINKVKIAIFNDDYPDENNIPGNMFVHTRVRHYQTLGYTVKVFRRAQKSRRLTYEGIQIQDYSDVSDLLKLLDSFTPDANVVHFAAEPFISEVSTKLKAPLFVWVHGYEALAWYRSIFNMKLLGWYPHRVVLTHLQSRARLDAFTKLIDRSGKSEKIKFIFVSKWMKAICEADTRRSINNFEIIPNPIDTTRFAPGRINGKERNILVIRSSQDYKYAPDQIFLIINKLMSDKRNKYKCRIFSNGVLFDKYFAPLNGISGVEVHKGFLTQEEIAEQHNWGGIFLCPTRQDAQGVSMCEAMSSGLVVATNPVTAIPEFATHDHAILSESVSQLVKDIKRHASDCDMMARKSFAASQFVRNTLSADVVCARELSAISGY